MKSKEELNALKEEIETVSKRRMLTDEELEQVSGCDGGASPSFSKPVIEQPSVADAEVGQL